MTLIRRNFSNWPNLTDFFDDEWIRNRFANTDLSPAVNVVDNEGNYEIEVAAPGFKKDDIQVTVENGVLTITGKVENESEEKKKNYTRKEFSSQSFTKRFTLPENVEQDKLSAKYEDGVLRLVVNKREKELPSKKNVEVQ
ncbi:MAG: Hsp20/alpha crystallin family protein [Flavobacteriales bacterium]|nr:Hsp20/alpha crystallin family protein [Flavobacteriales bacterium]MCB9448288.1 Hsp20/alpha crystallin family protein [Flavobacteriales bacterium]